MIWISYVDLFTDFPSPHPVSPQQPSVLGLLATASPVMTPSLATTPLVMTPLRSSSLMRNRWGIHSPTEWILRRICFSPAKDLFLPLNAAWGQ